VILAVFSCSEDPTALRKAVGFTFDDHPEVKVMAHKVEFSIPGQQTLGNADVEFVVSKNDSKLGTLRISKGSLVWFPFNTWYGYKLDWTTFGKLMQEEGVQSEKR
jgi:hypothetical protein